MEVDDSTLDVGEDACEPSLDDTPGSESHMQE